MVEGLTFASRFDKVTGSAIREIFKYLAKPGMISFAGGNPSLAALPDEICSELAQNVLKADGKRILQYGATEGYPPFVESLSQYLTEQYGFDLEMNGVLPTTGSTSCMDLLLKAFVNPGDAGSSKIVAVMEQRQKGKNVKVILLSDLEATLNGTKASKSAATTNAAKKASTSGSMTWPPRSRT